MKQYVESVIGLFIIIVFLYCVIGFFSIGFNALTTSIGTDTKSAFIACAVASAVLGLTQFLKGGNNAA